MKNTILKTTVCAALVVIGTSAFAGDHHRGSDHHHDKNNGVRLAADIVNLVGSSLNILRGGPTVVYETPAYCPPPAPPAPRHHHHHVEPPRRHDHGNHGGHGGHGPGPRR